MPISYWISTTRQFIWQATQQLERCGLNLIDWSTLSCTANENCSCWLCPELRVAYLVESQRCWRDCKAGKLDMLNEITMVKSEVRIWLYMLWEWIQASCYKHTHQQNDLQQFSTSLIFRAGLKGAICQILVLPEHMNCISLESNKAQQIQGSESLHHFLGLVFLVYRHWRECLRSGDDCVLTGGDVMEYCDMEILP